MSKFDQIYNSIKEGMSVVPTNTSTYGSNNPNQNQNVIQGLVGQMSKDIKSNNQQAQKDLQNLVSAIQKNDKNMVDNIVKKYAEQALLAQKTTNVS